MIVVFFKELDVDDCSFRYHKLGKGMIFTLHNYNYITLPIVILNGTCFLTPQNLTQPNRSMASKD